MAWCGKYSDGLLFIMYRWIQTADSATKKIAKSTRFAFNKWNALILLLQKLRYSDLRSKLIFHPPFISSRFNCLEICPNNNLIIEKKTNQIRASTQRFFRQENWTGARNQTSTQNPLCVSARVFLDDLHASGYASSHQSYAAPKILNDERCKL